MLEEIIEVIALHDHIVEFQEGKTLFHALLVALGTKHVIDREAGAHIAQQIDIIELQEPVGVVDHDGLVVAEFNEAFHLMFETLTVVLNGLRGHHGAHIGTAGGVADIAGAAADQDDRTVPCHLQALHEAESHKVTDMQAVCRGVKADIKGRLTVVDELFDLFLVSHLSDEPAGNEFVINGHFLFSFIKMKLKL